MSDRLFEPFRPLIKGVYYRVSKIYHGRYELRFYGAAGTAHRRWILETFGDDDDMVYAQGHGYENYYESLVSGVQLSLLALKRS